MFVGKARSLTRKH